MTENKPLFIALVVLGGVSVAGIVFAIVAAVVQGRDPASIAIALCPVLGAALTALVLGKKKDDDAK